MLCEVHALGASAVSTWLALSVIGLVAVLSASGAVFWAYFARPTYAQWRRKLDVSYPPAEKVRLEVLQTLRSIAVSTICPALSLHLAQSRGGASKAYCGAAPAGALPHVAQFLLIWVITDLYEWAYHYIGHTVRALWANHKAHHLFFNPTPFAVIADDMVDQFVRSAPLLLFPLVMPMNIDLLFGVFAVFFYGYGVLLHLGHEVDVRALSVHGAIGSRINGAYEHYCA